MRVGGFFEVEGAALPNHCRSVPLIYPFPRSWLRPFPSTLRLWLDPRAHAQALAQALAQAQADAHVRAHARCCMCTWIVSLSTV